MHTLHLITNSTHSADRVFLKYIFGLTSIMHSVQTQRTVPLQQPAPEGSWAKLELKPSTRSPSLAALHSQKLGRTIEKLSYTKK